MRLLLTEGEGCLVAHAADTAVGLYHLLSERCDNLDARRAVGDDLVDLELLERNALGTVYRQQAAHGMSHNTEIVKFLLLSHTSDAVDKGCY